LPKTDLPTARRFSNKIIQTVRADGRNVLLENESENIARAYAIMVPKSGVAHNKRETMSIGLRLGFPVVLKVLSRNLFTKPNTAELSLRSIREMKLESLSIGC
jgi:acyl-CoA synthetase (NDP forming)